MPLSSLLNQPRIHGLRSALDVLDAPEPVREALDPEAREAAVALVLRDRGGLEVLLIKRAEIDGDPWSGHMALPGGKRDRDDATLVDTAIREAWEETGLDLVSRGLHLGRLSFVAPRTPRLPPLYITPHVFAVPGSSRAVPDPGEVEEVLWIPLETLASPEIHGEVTIRFGSESRDFPALRIDNRIIWGLTHRILTEFLEVIEPLEGLG